MKGEKYEKVERKEEVDSVVGCSLPTCISNTETPPGGPYTLRSSLPSPVFTGDTEV